MYLSISGEKLISEVLKDFSREYPYLKLEFFRNPVQKHSYPLVKIIPHYLQVKDAWSGKKHDGELEIGSMMTVAALEHALMDQFGLSAQLFRKSGNLWLETTITDTWTLRQQNEHGREISTDTRRPPASEENENDYDLNRQS